MVVLKFLVNVSQSTNYLRYNCSFDIPQLLYLSSQVLAFGWFLLAPSLWCFDLQEQLCWRFCILSSIYQWLQYMAFAVLFPFVPELQSLKVFYICHSPNTGSGGCENHLSLHSISNFLNRSQCTFFHVCLVSYCIGITLAQNTNSQYGGQFNFHFVEPA